MPCLRLARYFVFLAAVFLPLSKAGAEISPKVRYYVEIPAGEFTMILEKDGRREERRIYLDAYEIDGFEASIHEYTMCVLQGKCSLTPLIMTVAHLHKDELMPEGSERAAKFQKIMEAPGGSGQPFWKYIDEYPDYLEIFTLVLPKAINAKEPIGYLDSREAWGYCAFTGGRLPTNAEWEKAARGSVDAREYPWGDEAPVDCRYGNVSGLFDPVPTGCPEGPVSARSEQYPPSPVRAYNMIGNQREFIVDVYEPTYPEHLEYKNPVGLPGFIANLPSRDAKIFRVMTKGGGYMKLEAKKGGALPLPQYTPASISGIELWRGRAPDSGVRCVRSEIKIKMY